MTESASVVQDAYWLRISRAALSLAKRFSILWLYIGVAFYVVNLASSVPRSSNSLWDSFFDSDLIIATATGSFGTALILTLLRSPTTHILKLSFPDWKTATDVSLNKPIWTVPTSPQEIRHESQLSESESSTLKKFRAIDQIDKRVAKLQARSSWILLSIAALLIAAAVIIVFAGKLTSLDAAAANEIDNITDEIALTQVRIGKISEVADLVDIQHSK